jgi:hypothetical protein
MHKIEYAITRGTDLRCTAAESCKQYLRISDTIKLVVSI